MSAKKHLGFLVQALVTWAAFFALGLPSYFQQYSTVLMAVGSVLVQALIGVWAVAVLLPVKPERRVGQALWLSAYFSVPLAICDTLYCGVWLGLGHTYLTTYWYLTVFYASVWVALVPTALVLNRLERRSSATNASSHTPGA